MDYRALTTFRETFESYNFAAKQASKKPALPPVPTALRQAANRLPPAEIIREIGALPNNILRVLIIRDVCQPSPLRRQALSSTLFHDPKYVNPRNKRTWYKALGNLVENWEALESDDPHEQSESSLRILRNRVEEAVPKGTSSSLPLATLVVTADVGLQKIENLVRQINEAAALLENGQLAYAHDGLQEVVQSLWAQIRSEYPALSQLTRHEVEGCERDAAITRVESTIAALRRKHNSLICLGFDLPSLEVAKGEGRGIVDDDDDEDEWEDAWEEPVKFDELEVADDGANDADKERATRKPGRFNDGIDNFLNGNAGGSKQRSEAEVKALAECTAAIKGDEGDRINQLLLDQMEEKAALEPNGDSTIASIRGVHDSGRVMQKRQNRRGGKEAAGTARQRIRARLGIKKRKKRSLLD